MSRSVMIAQEIRTVWSKPARGGEGAAERNAVPEAAPIPANQVLAAAGLDLFHHRLIYISHGKTGFTTPVREEFIKNPNLRPYPMGCVQIERAPDEEEVRATFHYDTGCGGAPERGWMHKTLFLAMGQWGRIAYNGRHTGGFDSVWRYEKTVVNVGLFILPFPDGSLFMRTEPSQRFSAMAHLF